MVVASLFDKHPIAFALVCALVAVAFGIGFTVWLLGRPAGSERMQEIARAVQEGAAAYLRKQYTTIAVVAVVPFLLLGFYHKLGWGTAIGFLIGALLSAAAGFIGMNVAVRSNVRTAEAARSGLAPALNVAFRAGSVTGLLVVGLGLLGVAGYYWALTDWLNHTPRSAIDDLVGLAFGGSLISVFARLGGGIYTKAADVGAVMLIAALSFPNSELWLYPLAIGGISILASIVGTFFARVGRRGSIMNALYQAVIVATVLSAIGFIPVTMGFDSAGKFSFWHLYLSALVGLAVTFLLVLLT